MKLSVVIPAYNEQRTIAAIIEKVATARLPQGLTREIIVVDDCSRDETGAILGSLKQKYSLTIIRQGRNQGKGAALRTGLRAATGDVILIQDADLEYDPVDYPVLLQPLIDGRADVVYGSRYLGKRVKDVMSLNFIANKLLTAASNIFTGFHITDMETCYKAYSASALKQILPDLRSDRFDIEPELTSAAARHSLRVAEVPISYNPRTAREGKKIKLRDGFPALFSIVRFGPRPFAGSGRT